MEESSGEKTRQASWHPEFTQGRIDVRKEDVPSIANSSMRTHPPRHQLAAAFSTGIGRIDRTPGYPVTGRCSDSGGSTMELNIPMANIAKAALAVLALALLSVPIAQSEGETNATLTGQVLEVTGHVVVSHADAADNALEDASQVVVWLVPAQTGHKNQTAVESPHYRIVQRDKTFKPGFLVIPVGSTVDFPNYDQWFHNVFSISRGRQFDLGLYQAGELRSVMFDRTGVSYLFCSIHPDMMAVVVTVDSTYFGVSDKGGRFAIESVPPGQYFLHVWRENATPQGFRATSRLAFVGGHHGLPVISVSRSSAKATNPKTWMQ
jgi:plastocyanin